MSLMAEELGEHEKAAWWRRRSRAVSTQVHTLLWDEADGFYYDRDMDGVPRGWVKVMKEAIVMAGKEFTTGRMVRDYCEQYYVAALQGRVEKDDRPVFADPVFLEDVAPAGD